MIALALDPVSIYPPLFAMSIPRENTLNRDSER